MVTSFDTNLSVAVKFKHITKEGLLNRLASRIKYAALGFCCIFVSIALMQCSDYKKPTTGSSCAAPASWFSGDTIPTPNPNDTLVTNCDFHKLSWQYFLWLTEEVKPGKLRFETMYNAASINPAVKDPTYHILGGVQQAESNGILVDQNGRAVYTTLIINDVYRNWVIQNKLYD